MGNILTEINWSSRDKQLMYGIMLILVKDAFYLDTVQLTITNECR